MGDLEIAPKRQREQHAQPPLVGCPCPLSSAFSPAAAAKIRTQTHKSAPLARSLARSNTKTHAPERHESERGREGECQPGCSARPSPSLLSSPRRAAAALCRLARLACIPPSSGCNTLSCPLKRAAYSHPHRPFHHLLEPPPIFLAGRAAFAFAAISKAHTPNKALRYASHRIPSRQRVPLLRRNRSSAGNQARLLLKLDPPISLHIFRPPWT